MPELQGGEEEMRPNSGQGLFAMHTARLGMFSSGNKLTDTEAINHPESIIRCVG